jgi:hypothetical protein
MGDVRSFIEIHPGIRDRLQQAIEALVDVLDSLEHDIDLEDGGDDELTGDEEPLLGATTGMHQGHAWKVPTDEADEAEPSLGWVGEGRGFYGMALPGYADDLEEQHDREHELTDDNCIGDADGLNEQMSISVGGYGRVE